MFVAEHASEWDDATIGEQDGSGSPIKKMATYRSLHARFLEIMETWLERILTQQGASLEDFMGDVKKMISQDSHLKMGPRTKSR